MADLGQHRADAGDLFVGRESLLSDVTVRTERGSHLLLEGAPGVGKSRLAAELLRRIGDRPTERLLASRGTSRHPFGLFASHGHLAGIAPAAVAALFDRHLGRWRAMSRRSGPVVVWVDDIPRADELSASLLRQAVAAGLIQLIGTARAGVAPAPDVEALVEEGLLEVVEVPPLGPADTEALARAWARGPLTDDEVQDVQRLSGGHPLFIRELVRGGYGPGRRPATLAALVEHRLAALSVDGRRIAEMIAVAEPVHHALFDRDRDRDTVLELLGSGLVIWSDDEHLRIEHPYYSAALVDTVGPMSAGLYAALVDRADDEHVDPVVLTEWMLKAERPPDPERAERAARFALGRGDAVRARLFADHAGGAADLLRAEALIAEGRLDDGLDRLAALRRSDGPVAVRVAAASSEARQRALTCADYPSAHRILAEADSIADTPRLRRPLLLARTWLWMFGAISDDVDLSLADEATAVESEHELLTFEIVSGCCGTLYQLSPSAAEPVLRTMLTMEEDSQDHDDFVWSRTRGLESTFQWHAGNAEAARDVLVRAADDPRSATHSAGTIIAGNLTLAAALGGRFPEAAAAARAVREGGLADDPYRFVEIARLAHLGNHAVAGLGPAPEAWPSTPPTGEDVRTLELMMATRAHALHSPRADIAVPVRTLIDARARGWLALLYADVGDGRQRAVHPLVRDAYAASPRFGLWATVFDLADARTRGDAGALLAAGERLLAQGFVAGATRALADVVRLAPGDGAAALAARQGIARAIRRWQAPRPEWLSDIELPSERQLAAAELVISGRTVAEIADEWCVSRRTVENHLYRASHVLGVSGMDELVQVLAGSASD